MGRTRRARCKRNQNGGGLGSTYGFTAAPFGGTVNNAIAWTPASSCVEETRPGFMASGYSGPKGLPGMSGGRRRRGRKGSRRSQKGGRYGFDGSDTMGMSTPWASARAPIEAIPCEASRSAVPDSGAAGMLNKVGGPLWDGPVLGKGQMGGANPAVADASASAPVGGPTQGQGSEVYQAPTAGYTHLQGSGGAFQTAAGTYEMINVPQNAREMNPACLKTGGGRRRNKSRKAQKKQKNRKSRKGSRKH